MYQNIFQMLSPTNDFQTISNVCPAQDANNVHFDELFVLENSGLGGDERVREEEELAGSRIHEYRSSEQVNLSAEDDETLTLRYARPAQNGDTSQLPADAIPNNFFFKMEVWVNGRILTLECILIADFSEILYM